MSQYSYLLNPNLINSSYQLESLSYIIMHDQNIYLFVGLIIVIVLTVVSNLFVLLTVICNKKFQNYINIQYASMAVADTFVGVIPMTSLLISTMYGFWPLNDSLCILWCIFDFVCCNVSSLNIVSISFYQLKCIVKPFKTVSKSYRLEIVTVLLIWLIPFTFWTTSIVLIIYKYKYTTDYMDPYQCYFMYSPLYVLLADSIFYLLPAVLIALAQVLIYFALKRKSNKLLSRNGQDNQKTINKEIKAKCEVSVIEADQKTDFKTKMTSEIAKSSEAALNKKFSNGKENVESNLKNNNENANSSVIDLDEFGDSVLYDVNMENLDEIKHKNVSKGKKSQEKMRKLKLEKDQRAFRVLFFVASSFLLLWLPWITVW